MMKAECASAEAPEGAAEASAPSAPNPVDQETDPLQRKRLLLSSLARHWAWLAAVALAGASALGLLCFFSIRASLRMCEYVVTDQLRYQGYPSSLGATTELMRCRFTLKNFAWNEHWLMFLPYGVGKELFDMLVPIITGLSLYGDKLKWKPRRKRFFTVVLPVLCALFVIFWHAGLGQPGVLRATPGGGLFFALVTIACYIEMGGLLKNMDGESRINENWLFAIFGFAVLFPTLVYPSVVVPCMFGRDTFFTLQIVVRVLWHPFVCEVGLSILRNFARQVQGARQGMAALMYVSLLITRAVFARFLMIQVKNAGSLVLLQLCLTLMDTIPRLTTKEADASYLQLLYGTRPAEALMSTRRHNDLFVFETQLSMLCEYAAIVSMPIFLYTANVTLVGDVIFTVAELVKTCAAQLAMQLAFDLLWIGYDVLYYGVEHLQVWARRDRAYLPFLAIIFMAQAYFTLYDSVFSLFCPLGADQTSLPGLRMDKCAAQTQRAYQGTLPQYFPLKRFPNYAPGAAAPIFNVSDFVIYSKSMNPTRCGGISPLENCMLDSFRVQVRMDSMDG